MKEIFLVCVSKYDQFDYSFSYSEKEMKEHCKEYEKDGWEIEVAAQIEIVKDYLTSKRKRPSFRRR